MCYLDEQFRATQGQLGSNLWPLRPNNSRATRKAWLQNEHVLQRYQEDAEGRLLTVPEDSQTYCGPNIWPTGRVSGI